MKVLNIILITLCFLLMGAHFLRAGWNVLMLLSLASPLLLLYRKKWVALLLQLFLLFGAIEWIRTMVETISFRMNTGQDWSRFFIILLVVVMLTLYSGISLRIKPLKDHFK